MRSCQNHSSSILLLIVLFRQTCRIHSFAWISTGLKRNRAYRSQCSHSRRQQWRQQQEQQQPSLYRPVTFPAVSSHSIDDQSHFAQRFEEKFMHESSQKNDDDDDDGTDEDTDLGPPVAPRVDQPSRPTRRMNQPFRYLYRHDFNESDLDLSPLDFLMQRGGFTHDQVAAFHRTFPAVVSLSTRHQLHPKLQFLKHTLFNSPNGGEYDEYSYCPTRVARCVPPVYFGSRLERIVAPRHAFLVWAGLPCGAQLLTETKHGLVSSKSSGSNDSNNTNSSNYNNNTATPNECDPTPLTECLFQDFMLTCRDSKQFAAMCQSWFHDYGLSHQPRQQSSSSSSSSSSSGAGAEALFRNGRTITAKDVEAFDALFARGILSAVRNELVQPNNMWPKQQLPTLRAVDLVSLHIQHGADSLARDHRGATLLHWACGTGHDEVVQLLLDRNYDWYPSLETIVAKRDGATPLHWAAAGCNAREFGIGGHERTCQLLLDHVQKQATRSTADTDQARLVVSSYVNSVSLDGNSALMWAAWSGTLDTVQQLIRNGADVTIRNRNGCTVAHWAASGGNRNVCEYLHTVDAFVDFLSPNRGGNTPLTHAVAFQRTEVIEWLLELQRQRQLQLRVIVDASTALLRDDKAYQLAKDFVHWTDGQDSQRRKVLQLFVDDLNGTNSL